MTRTRRLTCSRQLVDSPHMAAATHVPINGSVLEWAMDQAAVSDEEVAARCKVTAETVRLWRQGAALPSKTQFRHLVTLLKRPSAAFFLPEPPTLDDIPPAFRRSPSAVARALTPKEARAIRTARRVQRVSRWIVERRGEEVSELPRVRRGSAATEAAGLAASYLGWTVHQQIEAHNPSAVLKELRVTLEANNLLVLQLPLSDKGHRGFSLYDRLAPLIAVNSAYNPSARIFSYVHELGHLLTRTDSICYQTPNQHDERWCEEFAAAFLLPNDALTDFILKKFGPNPIEDFYQIQRIANYFNVSLRAVTVRLIQLNRAHQNLYDEVDARADFRKPGGGGGKGATSPEIRLREWGSRYPALLLEAEHAGLLQRQDLLEYLNLSSTQLRSLEDILTTQSWSEDFSGHWGEGS